MRAINNLNFHGGARAGTVARSLFDCAGGDKQALKLKHLVPRSALLVFLFFFGTQILLAQNSPASSAATDSQSQRIAALEEQAADAKSSADNGWMLVCSALVLMMTGPGLALFYGGLVRKKNVLATMMQSFAMMAVITVLWAIVGYSIAFGPGNSFFGGFHDLFL